MADRPDRIIVLAEDSEDDEFLFRRALRKAEINTPVFRVGTGKDLCRYILGEGEFADRTVYPLPGLVVLDIRMPRMNGFGVLEWLRANPSLKTFRLVVLSGTCDSREVQRAKELGADACWEKPLTPHQANQLVACS